MNLHKIQPWDNEQEDNDGYLKKLQNLNNFNSQTFNLSKILSKKNPYLQELSQNKNKQKLFELRTAANFNKTNRSSYQHRITKLVFHEESAKKYKFQPDNPSSKIKTLAALHRVPKISSQAMIKHQNSSKQLRRTNRQIYYNLTQLNSPLNTIRLKCATEENDHTPDKIKILNRIHHPKSQERKLQSKPNSVCRQLSVERKIYMLQSGNGGLKELFPQKAWKNCKKSKNIIEEICLLERQQSREKLKKTLFKL